jgi:hypothetical protein
MRNQWIGISGLAVVLCITAGCQQMKSDDSLVARSFESDQTDATPAGWTVAETHGKGTPATWQVVKKSGEKGKCLAITANKNSGGTFNLLLLNDIQFKDLELSVMVKAIDGKEDQGGGPIWRVKDANNYYICRWNPLEDNLRLYVVKDGKRKQLASATVKADTSAWHKIEIDQDGAEIEVEFDGQEMISFTDTTFTEAGLIGLWVKADGRTQFDMFAADEE